MANDSELNTGIPGVNYISFPIARVTLFLVESGTFRPIEVITAFPRRS